MGNIVKKIFNVPRAKNLRYQQEKELIIKSDNRKQNAAVMVFSLSASAFFGYNIVGGFLISSNIHIGSVSTLLGVMGGAVVSFLISERNRENELNKHREKWVSDMRSEYSDFCSLINELRKKSLDDIDTSSINIQNEFLKFYANIDALGGLDKEIEFKYQMLSMYLISEYEDDPRRQLFNKVEQYYGILSDKADDVYILYRKYGNSSFDEFRVVEEKEGEVRDFMRSFSRFLTVDLGRLNYSVKVLIDYEWSKIYGYKEELNVRGLACVGVIVILLSAFISYVINGGVISTPGVT